MLVECLMSLHQCNLHQQMSFIFITSIVVILFEHFFFDTDNNLISLPQVRLQLSEMNINTFYNLTHPGNTSFINKIIFLSFVDREKIRVEM